VDAGVAREGGSLGDRQGGPMSGNPGLTKLAFSWKAA